MNEKKYIGFDLGAESGRCVVAILKNEKLELNEVHRFPTHNYKDETGFRWNIEKIFDEIILGLVKASEKFGKSYESIGIDTWGVDYAFVANNSLLNPPFHYRDDRTDNIMEEAFSVVSKNKLYNTTGTQFQQFNTLFQILAELKNKRSKINTAEKMLLIHDYLNYRLSGNMKAEYTIASTTGLVNPETREWAWELIDDFNIPKTIFPKMVEPGTNLGTLLPSIADEVGLSKDIKIIASAGHDTAAAVISVPAKNDNWAFLSSGTWSLMGLELEAPILNSKSMNFNFTNEGGFQNTIRFLKNIIGLWPIQECRRYWLSRGEEYSYQKMTDKASDVGNTKRWLDLNDSRFLKSGNMPEKINLFLKETNQSTSSDVGVIVRTVIESLAFNYKRTIEEIEEISNKKIKRLYAVGGGIKNELLNQLTADALGIEVVAGPIEGTIIGNIGVQAISTKAVSRLEDWRKIVSKSFPTKIYKPENPEYFQAHQADFNNICKINEIE